MEKLEMRLDLFGEGDAAAAEGAAAAETAQTGAGTESENAGVNALPAREGRRPNIFPAVQRQAVRRPQPEAVRQVPAANADAAQTQQQAPETFEEAIKGRWAKEYGEHVRAAVQERFRRREEQDKRYNAAMQALMNVAPMYGVLADDAESLDIEKLTQAIADDDRLYEQEALEKGVPTSTLKHIKQLEQRERQRQAEERRSLEQEQLRNHLSNLRRQEEELKREFPDFDLNAEAQNAAFVRMTGPGGGLTLRQAYMALHGDELMRRNIAQTEATTKRAMSQAIQAGSIRPQENSLTQTGGGAPQRDPRSYTRAERAEIRRRVMAGEQGIRP